MESTASLSDPFSFMDTTPWGVMGTSDTPSFTLVVVITNDKQETSSAWTFLKEGSDLLLFLQIVAICDSQRSITQKCCVWASLASMLYQLKTFHQNQNFQTLHLYNYTLKCK